MTASSNPDHFITDLGQDPHYSLQLDTCLYHTILFGRAVSLLQLESGSGIDAIQCSIMVKALDSGACR